MQISLMHRAQLQNCKCRHVLAECESMCAVVGKAQSSLNGSGATRDIALKLQFVVQTTRASHRRICAAERCSSHLNVHLDMFDVSAWASADRATGQASLSCGSGGAGGRPWVLHCSPLASSAVPLTARGQQ